MWIPSPTHRESDIEGLAYCSGTMVFINTSSFILQMVPIGESHLKKKTLFQENIFQWRKSESVKTKFAISVGLNMMMYRLTLFTSQFPVEVLFLSQYLSEYT